MADPILIGRSRAKAQNWIVIEDHLFVGSRDPSGKDLKSLRAVEEALADRLKAAKNLRVVAIFPRSEQIEAGGWRPWERRKRLYETLTKSIADKERVWFYEYKAKYCPALASSRKNFVHTKAWLFDDRSVSLCLRVSVSPAFACVSSISL
jgi:hypothetical protein